MFVIRKEQRRSLSQPLQQRFVERLRLYLREHFANWVDKLQEEELRAWVQRSLAKSLHYGVHFEPEAAQLILLFLLLGQNADQSLPWVKEVLADAELEAVGKVRRLIALSHEHKIEGIDEVVVNPDMEA